MISSKYQKHSSKSKNIFSFFIFVLTFCILIFGFWISPAFAQDDSKETESLFVAQKAFDDGFYDVALSLLERFLKNYPVSSKSPEVNLLIGQCYFHQHRFLEALKKFEEVLDQSGAKNIKDAVFCWIAEVHFRGNNFLRAASYYKMIIDEFPNSSYTPSAYYSLGWCLFQEEKFKEALENFKILEEKFPQQPQAQESLFKIIECLYNLKDYAALKERVKSYIKIYSHPKKDSPSYTFKQGAEDSSKLPYLYFYLAESDYYLNNFDQALGGYNKVILNTNDPKIEMLSKLGLGWASLKLKRYQQAGDTFFSISTELLDKRSIDVLYLGKAILYFETNRFLEAKNIYDELLNLTTDPLTLIQAYLGKADALYNLGEYKETINTYRAVADKIYSNKSVPAEIIDKLHYGLAWAYLKEGEFREAIEEFQKIVRHSEDKIFKISALCQIGDAYQDSGDYAKAQETYDSILKDYPDSLYNDYVQYQLGLTMLKLLNYEGAIMGFLNFKRNFPDSKLLDDATYALGLAYFQKQDYNSSKKIFRQFQEEFKDSNLSSEAMYLLGTSLYNLGEFNQAVEVFKNIVRLYSQNPELVQKAEYEIADAYYQMGNEKEAMSRFNMLRAKYPDSNLTAEIIWWLGEYYYRRNDLNLAVRYLSCLIRDFPNSSLIPDTYYALGSIYTQDSKYSEAISNFQKVIEIGKSDLAGQAAIAIADIYARQEKFDLAIDTYKDKVKEYSNLAYLIYPKLGDIFLKLTKYDEALEFYYKSLDLVPVRELAEMHFKIAEIRQTQGKIREAIEEYLKIPYLYSENKDLAVKAFLRVAKVYEEEEKFKEAINIYKKVITMDVPEARYAQERVEIIQSGCKELKSKK